MTTQLPHALVDPAAHVDRRITPPETVPCDTASEPNRKTTPSTLEAMALQLRQSIMSDDRDPALPSIIFARMAAELMEEAVRAARREGRS